MNQSRKDLSRGKLRRRRQLRELRQRKASGEDEPYLPEEFSFKAFLAKRKVEAIFIVLLVTGVLTVQLLAPDQKAVKALRDSIDAMITWQSLEFDQAHPHGYKIIAFRQQDIVMTSFDTLPDDLKIDWENMSVTRIQANQLTQTLEKVKIVLADINYPPAGISGQTVAVTLSRQKGAEISLGRFGEFEFIVKIVEDDGSNLFCLFGLRNL